MTANPKESDQKNLDGMRARYSDDNPMIVMAEYFCSMLPKQYRDSDFWKLIEASADYCDELVDPDDCG